MFSYNVIVTGGRHCEDKYKYIGNERERVELITNKDGLGPHVANVITEDFACRDKFQRKYFDHAELHENTWRDFTFRLQNNFDDLSRLDV
ncbi:hypothetical protein CDAR_321271 [Caerostris darwini]|uniref:Uncharacterized protein n=1 Tax=Caerostris darwini TaxID=1538125 RepID=A0AAV4NRH4_9ARAC|nr:hypothetical protein CDAR_321271 [Caerostris darwini]